MLLSEIDVIYRHRSGGGWRAWIVVVCSARLRHGPRELSA